MYLLGCYPFAGIIVAYASSQLKTTIEWRIGEGIGYLILALIGCAVVLAIAGNVPLPLKSADHIVLLAVQQRFLGESIAAKLTVMLPLLVGVGAAFQLWRGSPSLERLGIAFLISISCYNSTLFVWVADALSIKDYIPALRQMIPADAPLYGFGRQFFDASYYLRQPMQSLDAQPPPGSFVLVNSQDRERLFSVIGSSGRVEMLWESDRGVVKAKEKISLIKVN